MIRSLKRLIYPNGRSVKRYVPTCGIYEILHRPTKRRYVGSSAEIEKRLYYHVNQLSVNTHHCKYLQNVWNKYGKEGFQFFLLETCDVEVLAEREQFHMDSPSPYLLMNAEKGARTARGWKITEETRRKLQEAARSRSVSLEESRIRSARARQQHREGRIGKRKRLAISPKRCVTCKLPFLPIRLPSGLISQSKYCDKCRPEHKGGYYKYNRALLGEGKPKQQYRGGKL